MGTEHQDHEPQKVGGKVSCATCGTTVVVVKAPSSPIVCCGNPLGSSASVPEEASNG